MQNSRKTAEDYLVFPLDVPSMAPALDYVRLLDGRVGVFKIGLELFIQEGPAMVRRIREISRAAVFLDLKLHDISATVQRAMERAAALGADWITVHCASSRDMLEKAVKGAGGRTQVLGVTLLTDNDAETVAASGFKPEFAQNPDLLVLHRARMAHEAGCAGVVCSGREVRAVKNLFGPDFLAITPGIRPSWSLAPNDDQKRVTTPGDAVLRGSDLLVVGRPIRDAADPAEAARRVVQEIREALADRMNS